MQRLNTNLVALSVLLCLSACDQGRRTQATVYLPEGDETKGQEHFVSMGCSSCHTVVGVDLPEPEASGPVRVLLGSRTGRILTYGELVTSIVNPSHRLASRYPEDVVADEGQSIMTVYNDVMTVTQLTDLVAFLQAHYEKASRPGYRYPVYTYGSDDRPK